MLAVAFASMIPNEFLSKIWISEWILKSRQYLLYVNIKSRLTRINKSEFSTNALVKLTEGQKNNIKKANDQSDFIKFSEAANSAHATIHIELKCSMPSPATTAYDPTFWMHHTFLDKVLADRQSNEFYKVRV